MQPILFIALLLAGCGRLGFGADDATGDDDGGDGDGSTSGGCAPGFLFCDDFEQTALDARCVHDEHR